MSALLLTGYHLVQSQGYGVLSRVALVEPVVAAAVLTVVRPHLYLWLAAALLIGLRAGIRFLRPGARHARGPRWVKPTVHADRQQMSAAAGGPTVRRVVISSFDNPVHPHYQGGGVAVIKAMARLGEDFDVTVLTVGRRSESVLLNGIRYRRLPLEWAGPRAGQLVYHAVLPFAARRIRHDLWIENFTPPFSTSFLPLFVRTPVLGFAQALQGRELSRRYRFPFFLIERLGLRCYRDVLGAQPRGPGPGERGEPGGRRAPHPEWHPDGRPG